MCLGFESKGTLSEVLRGYTGDINSLSLYDSHSIVEICSLIKFKGSLFDRVGKATYLRPFELATLRLSNMVEVLSNWNIYIPYKQFLTQRGSTYIFDSSYNLLYSYKSKSLLSYSEQMPNPLWFLEKILEFK